MFIATINEYKGTNAKIDRSGNMPLILNVLGGKCPNKRMISLGWADTQEMNVGSTYLIDPVEIEAHELHGRQFQFNRVGKELDANSIVDFVENHPKQIYNVSEKVKVPSEQEFHKEETK